MLNSSVHRCSWVQLSGWHLAAAVAVALKSKLALVSWALRPRRKRHDVGVALQKGADSVRCPKRGGRKGRRRIHEDEDIRFEAALQRIKDCRDRGEPLSRLAAFQAVWCEGQWGSDADAAQAERRFAVLLSRYRARPSPPPEAWRRPGSRLAEVLAAPAGRGAWAARGCGQRR
jgi:hypothetical protein